MKNIISVFLALVIGFTSLCVNSSAASYKVRIKKEYKNGYTYVTLTPSSGTVYYTTDGSKADKNDKKYTRKIKITEPTTLKLVVYKNGKAVKYSSVRINVRVKTPSVTVYDEGEAQCNFYLLGPEGSSVYYTLDGSRPDEENSRTVGRAGFVKVNAGDTLRAVAVKDGWKESMVIKKTAAPTFDEIDIDEYEDEVIRLVNMERKKAGLNELIADRNLSEAAGIRADELLVSYSHDRPDGRSCFTVLDECGVQYVRSGCTWAGENIAAGQSSPKEVVKSWMNSPGHKANILNPDANKIGVGLSIGGSYGYNWAQLFTN